MNSLLVFWIPLAVYGWGGIQFLAMRQTRAHDALLASYYLLCLITTILIQVLIPFHGPTTLVVQAFKPLETLFLVGSFEAGGLLPPRRLPILTLLALGPWALAAAFIPGGLTDFRQPTFHLLTFAQCGLCASAIYWLTRQSCPMTDHASFWVAFPLLFNGVITLLVYLWRELLSRQDPSLNQMIRQFRAGSVIILYALMIRSFKCPFPRLSSSSSA